MLTWPLAARLRSAAIDLGDPLLNSWILAWDLHAFRHAPLHIFDANIFHPHRRTLAFSDHLLGLVPLAAPVALAGGGPVLRHNAVLLATFPLAGLTMFLLVRHLTGHAGAAGVAGVLYAFSHYRFGHLGHVQLLSHQWLPLLLLGLHRVVTGGGRWRNWALAAGAFALQALSSGYHAYFSAFAVVLFVLWVGGPAGRPALGRLTRRGLLVGGIVTLILLPAFLPYYRVRAEIGLTRARSELALYSARPTSYLAAPPANRWLGELTGSLRSPEGALVPGAVLLALAAVGLVTELARPARGQAAAPGAQEAAAGRRRWLRWIDPLLAGYLLLTLANACVVGGFAVRLGPLRLSQRHFEGAVGLILLALALRRLLHGRPVPLPGLGWLRRLGWPHPAGYYVGLTALAVLCSFGPALVVDGVLVARPLYDQLHKRVPGFDALRVPARFAILVTTGLAVLAGYGVAALARGLGRHGRRVAVVALGGLAVVEAWSVPLPFVDAPGDFGPATRWLAAVGSPGAVVELPMYREAQWETRRMLASTTHWRPLVNGYSGAFPSDYAQTVELLNEFPAPGAVGRLRALGVRFVVADRGQYAEETRQRLEPALRGAVPGVTVAAAFGETVILEVSRGP